MPQATTLSTPPPALTVSELNRKARQLLEMHLNTVWVEGELTNLACPSSGHWYFSLKDENAQVRCAFFRNERLKSPNTRAGFKPNEGTRVRVRAKVSLYEGRGDYQLIVESLEAAGIGALQQAFEALKKKLADEGLFNPEFKQPLPLYPQQIGVITSRTGAAIHDIVTVLKRRYPIARVILLPVAVQGKGAAEEIAHAIARAHTFEPTLDVLIVGRGGGSLEDLWAFNEEVVARAIFASEIPIISAVGHEIDFSIADFVADVRAATPSAAAELATPDQRELLTLLQQYEEALLSGMNHRVREYQQQVRWCYSQLKHPGQKLQEQAQHLDHLEIRLRKSVAACVQQEQARLHALDFRLHAYHPGEKLKLLALRLQQLQKQFKQQSTTFLKQKQQTLQSLVQLLNSVNPLQTLARGYAIVSDANHHIVQDVTSVKVGDRISARLDNGMLDCAVTGITITNKSA